MTKTKANPVCMYSQAVKYLLALLILSFSVVGSLTGTFLLHTFLGSPDNSDTKPSAMVDEVGNTISKLVRNKAMKQNFRGKNHFDPILT